MSLTLVCNIGGGCGTALLENSVRLGWKWGMHLGRKFYLIWCSIIRPFLNLSRPFACLFTMLSHDRPVKIYSTGSDKPCRAVLLMQFLRLIFSLHSATTSSASKCVPHGRIVSKLGGLFSYISGRRTSEDTISRQRCFPYAPSANSTPLEVGWTGSA